MTDQTERVEVSVSLVQEYEFDIDPDTDVPDGMTVEDVAHNRAIEKAVNELREWPGAFLTTEDIVPVE